MAKAPDRPTKRQRGAAWLKIVSMRSISSCSQPSGAAAVGKGAQQSASRRARPRRLVMLGKIRGPDDELLSGRPEAQVLAVDLRRTVTSWGAA
jgi:hypothetical protein